MSAVSRPASGSPPTCAPAAHVDMSEGAMTMCCPIDANASGQLGMLSLDILHRAQNDLRVTRVHPTVVVQVGHASGTIVDIDVGGVAIHVPTELRSATNAAAMTIVPRRAEA